MRIYLPNVSEQEIGGGWTFLRNLKAGLGPQCEFTDNMHDCDVYFITSVTLANPQEVEEAHRLGKVIIFRVDNIPKKSRNKRSRVYDNIRKYAELADMVVFQSEWAQTYAGYLFAPDTPSMVIYNGVDTDVFFRAPEPEETDVRVPLKYLYVQYNRDENKRWPEAAYHFHMRQREDKRATLTIVGNFSPENFNDDGTPHFDFFDNELITYIPPIHDRALLAEIYREHDILLFPAFADAAPNTVLKARACGLRVELVNPIGGTKEMLDPDLDISLSRMCGEYRILFEFLLADKINEQNQINE